MDIKVIFGHTGLIKEWIHKSEIEFGFVLDNDDLTAFSLENVYKGAFRFLNSPLKTHNQGATSCLFPPARFEVSL